MATVKAVIAIPERRRMEQYEIEEAARTIARAEEHKKNKPLMKAVRQHVTKIHQAVSEKKPPMKPAKRSSK